MATRNDFKCDLCGTILSTAAWLERYKNNQTCRKKAVKQSSQGTVSADDAQARATVRGKLRSTFRSARTLRRIPKGARSTAAAALLKVIRECVQTNSPETWCALLTFPSTAFAQAGKASKGEQSLTSVVKANISRPQTSAVPPLKQHARKKPPDDDAAIRKRVEAKLNEGDISGAVRTLASEDSIAPRNTKTLESLIKKHPAEQPDVDNMILPDDLPAANIVTSEEIRNAILSFPNGSAGGADGLRPQHLRDLTSGLSDVMAEEMLEALASLASLLLSGKKCLRQYFLFVYRMYGQPSNLFYGHQILSSARGVQQGDPLGPLLFCLVTRELSRSLQSPNCWYLDDATVGGDLDIFLEDLQTVIDQCATLGLELNMSKCEMYIYGGSKKEQATTKSNFPEVGFPDECRSAASGPVWKFSALLRNFDEVLRSSVASITNAKMTDLVWRQTSLPVVKNGLGLRPAEEIALPAYLASIFSAKRLVTSMVADFDVDKLCAAEQAAWVEQSGVELPMPELRVHQRLWDQPIVQKHFFAVVAAYSESEEETARFLAASTTESGAWLNALPASCPVNLLDNDSLRISIGLRLGAPICEPHTCRCSATVDIHGRHGLSCPSRSGAVLRDDSQKRPDRMTLVPWKEGKALVWDVTCDDSVCQIYRKGSAQNAGYAANKAEENKRLKYQRLEGSYFFCPVGFETFGPAATSLLTEIEKRMAHRTGTKRSSEFLRQRISIDIQRGHCATFNARRDLRPSLHYIDITPPITFRQFGANGRSFATFVVTNPAANTVMYRLEKDAEKSLFISPRFGVMEPGDHRLIVAYLSSCRPKALISKELSLVLNDNEDSDATFPVQFRAFNDSEIRVTMADTLIFPDTFLNLTSQLPFELSSGSAFPLRYKWYVLDTVGRYLQVSPSSGLLISHDSLDFTFTFKPYAVQTYQTDLVLRVTAPNANFLSLRLSVTAKGTLGHLSVERKTLTL
ncbi:hypothetical protein RvY_12261 [Ramazzottius varieornatus]|uniref:Reverse transcriptase domain-containing protein n=1 Tax=Ramazzottius varieornatus TaxID=947166 RepID=A0A1D1VIZ6_RAMVA|nr:hypothetical protein RvY_12261 [Ramazzottius varieornatus]